VKHILIPGKCGGPGKPVNGFLSDFDFYEGKVIKFSCKHGFDLIGSQTTQCLRTGRWSKQVPVCKSKTLILLINLII
jgi:hypothetical protein